MNKPIIRWTIGNIKKSGYTLLDLSIKNLLRLYSNDFKYYVFYNDVDFEKINKLIKKYKNINFIKQNWKDCPIKLPEPKIIDEKTNQKLNGSFWKICPPRISINSHEIILDNDLVFLKKPKIIDEFLSTNKNLIIRDANIYLGFFEKLFKNETQGYNSGLIGLAPGYDFSKDLTNYFNIIKDKEQLGYADEQGLLMYSLYRTKPLIGSSEDFVGIHPKMIYLRCLSKKYFSDIKDKFADSKKNEQIELNKEIIKKVFEQASVIHFLKSNTKDNHDAFKYFKNKIFL